jgi:hypothetical protein
LWRLQDIVQVYGRDACLLDCRHLVAMYYNVSLFLVACRCLCWV